MRSIILPTVFLAFCATLTDVQAQPLVTDSTYNLEEKVAIYEKNKVVVSNGVRVFESKDEYFERLMNWTRPPSGHTCLLICPNHNWDAYQACTLLTEEAFFTITGCLNEVNKIRSYKSKKRFMKWSSPFLIIGGVLMAGISSNWGRKKETSATAVVGLGVSVTGLIFSAEGISK
ncbi:MAG: hypothetical protein WBB67_01390 [bacterium]